MHAAVAQGQKEGRIAREAVQLGNDKGGAGQAGQLDGGGELRAVGIFAALDFGEAGEDLGASGCGKAVDRIALRFQSESTLPLPRR